MTQQVQVKICPAASLTDDEVQQLVTLINAAYARHRWLFPNPRTSVEGYRPEVAATDVILLLMPPDEADSSRSYKPIVGTAYIHPDDEHSDALYFGLVAIDPMQQGQGLGGLLLQTIEQIARQRGFAKIRLIAAAEIGNEAYYLHHGFQTVQREPRPIGTWGCIAPYTLVTMEKVVL